MMRGRRLAREGNEEVVKDVCQCEFQGGESRETQRRKENEREKKDKQSRGRVKSKKKRNLNWRAKKEETIHMCNGSRKDKGIWRRCLVCTLKYYWKRTFMLDIELVGYISNKH